MNIFLPLLLLISTVHTGVGNEVFEIGIPVAIMPSDGTAKMYQALGEQGLNGYAQLILIAQAKVESACGTKGVARKNGYNWWNISCLESYEGKKRMCFEREDSKRVKKFWYVWDTPEEAAAGMIAYLNRKYLGAMEAAERMDVKAYVRILHKGNYFTSDAGEYERNMRRAVGEIEKGGIMHQLTDMKLLEGKTESISMMDLRKHAGEVINQVQMGKVFTITKSGKIVAVLALPEPNAIEIGAKIRQLGLQGR